MKRAEWVVARDRHHTEGGGTVYTAHSGPPSSELSGAHRFSTRKSAEQFASNANDITKVLGQTLGGMLDCSDAAGLDAFVAAHGWYVVMV